MFLPAYWLLTSSYMDPLGWLIGLSIGGLICVVYWYAVERPSERKWELEHQKWLQEMHRRSALGDYQGKPLGR